MKFFTSLKNLVVYSLVLLVSVGSLLFTIPTAIAAVDIANTQNTQYIASNTTALTVEQIDELIAYYREQKQGVSKNEILTNQTIKEILKEINSEINALIKEKKALLTTTN